MRTTDPLKAAGIAYVAIDTLTPYVRNARTYSKKQIKQIAKSIERFGFVNPVLISDDAVPESDGPVITQSGDIWQMGNHRLICGDARDGEVIAHLLQGTPPDMMFTDPPYNVKIDGPRNDKHALHDLRLAKQRDYLPIEYIILTHQRPRGSSHHRRLAMFQMCSFDMLLPERQQLKGDAWNTMIAPLCALPMADLKDWRRELRI